MFLGYQINKDGQEVIASVRETKEELENIPCVTFSRIEETEDTYVLYQGKWIKDTEKTTIENKQLSAEKRAERDRRIDAVRWRIERYQTQKAADLPTTDTAEQYQALLIYVQALRDVPEQAGFPNIIEWPVIEEKKENRKDTEEPDITPESESTEEIE